MSRSNTGKNGEATGYLSIVAALSLHSSDPGTTGINELAGGSPAYARKPRPTLPVPTTGAITFQVTFDVGAGSTPAYAGMWDASGNFIEGGPTFPGGTTPSAYASQGTFTLTVNGQGN